MSGARGRRAGFTLIEAMISMAILAIVGVTFAASMRSMAGLAHSGVTRSDVQHMAAEALEEVLDDLRTSGFVGVGGLDYPYLFEGGVAEDGFEAHAHVVPPGAAVEGDYDWGPTREIVFVQPADADADNLPDIDALGQVVFGADEISYVLGVNAQGMRVLERRVNGVLDRIVAESVERVVFDDALTTGFQVPFNAVRVRLYFRARDRQGHEVRHFVEGTTRLRNG